MPTVFNKGGDDAVQSGGDVMIDESRAARRSGRRGPDVRCRTGARARGGSGAPAVPEVPAVPAGLDVSVVRERSDAVVAEVVGEIDLHTADVLRARLIKLHGGGPRRIVVDFAGVPFCDATGLGALVAAHNQISAEGGEIHLARVRPAQLRLLRITGLHRLFTVHADIAGALSAAGSSA